MNKNLLTIIIVFSVIIIGVIYFFFPKDAGSTCGSCYGPPYIVSTEHGCIGFKYDKQSPEGCSDCGILIKCSGIVTPGKKCYTYSEDNGVKTRFAEVPNCKEPETWEEVLKICPDCYYEAAKLAYNANNLTKAIEICTSINDTEGKDSCYVNLASLKKDSSVCEQIPDNNSKNNCFTSLGIKLPITADLFVMSQCPYAQIFEKIMPSLEQLWGYKIDINLHYVIYNNFSKGYPEYCIDRGEEYCSVHGAQEVRQDIRELCVQKYQRDKLWDFVNKINNYTSIGNIESMWSIEAQSLGIDVNKIRTCQEQEGKELLDQELQLLQKIYPVEDPSKHNGRYNILIDTSPVLVINGIVYDGGRTLEGIQDTICSSFENLPRECK